MNDAEKTQLTNEAFGGTATAMTTPIRETIDYLDGRGLLGQNATKVSSIDIKEGDWIAYFYESGTPGEFYQARTDRDTNYNGSYGEFFRLERSLFGKEKPVVKVTELEPGTTFRAVLLRKEPASYVRLKGDGVRGITDGGTRWCAINTDFTDIVVLD